MKETVLCKKGNYVVILDNFWDIQVNKKLVDHFANNKGNSFRQKKKLCSNFGQFLGQNKKDRFTLVITHGFCLLFFFFFLFFFQLQNLSLTFGY